MILFGGRGHSSAHSLCLVNSEAESNHDAVMSLPQPMAVLIKSKALQPRAAGEGTVPSKNLSKAQGLPVGLEPAGGI